MPLLMFLLLVWSGSPSSGQRYAERNVVPMPDPEPPDVPSAASEDYDDEYVYGDEDEDSYGFLDEREPDVYKWSVDRYPHPVDSPRFCNRMRPSHVCDPDLVLEREQADLLDESLEDLRRSTPCICDSCDDSDSKGGFVVGVALMRNLRHPYHVHHAKVIRSFAERLRVRWRLGACDNDVLIVVATDDRLSYTDVGLSASAYLSVHEAHRIFLENKAKFSASNFSEGLADIVAGYQRATRGMRGRRERSGPGLDAGPVAGAIVGGVALMGVLLFLGAILVYCRRRRGRRSSKNPEEEEGRDPGPETVSSSWSKKDIKVLFAPEKSSRGSKYQKCGTTDEGDDAAVRGRGGGGENEDDDLDLTLATPYDEGAHHSLPDRTRPTTSDSEMLERDLDTAAVVLAKAFPSPDSGRSILMTEM